MTNVEIVSLLIGDADNTLLTEDQIQAFLDLNAGLTGNELLFSAAAVACDVLATKAAQDASSFSLGDYSESRKNNVQAYRDSAQKFRDLVEVDTPAFAVAELNLTDANALSIIRNYVLRNEL